MITIIGNFALIAKKSNCILIVSIQKLRKSRWNRLKRHEDQQCNVMQEKIWINGKMVIYINGLESLIKAGFFHENSHYIHNGIQAD